MAQETITAEAFREMYADEKKDRPKGRLMGRENEVPPKIWHQWETDVVVSDLVDTTTTVYECRTVGALIKRLMTEQKAAEADDRTLTAYGEIRIMRRDQGDPVLARLS